jgi:hypothetical protein
LFEVTSNVPHRNSFALSLQRLIANMVYLFRQSTWWEKDVFVNVSCSQNKIWGGRSGQAETNKARSPRRRAWMLFMVSLLLINLWQLYILCSYSWRGTNHSQRCKKASDKQQHCKKSTTKLIRLFYTARFRIVSCGQK